ncbi:MAG: putative damage-inducible protein DinB [Saprospiraceae bacterium]|jgi:uncharacterized damage-inducible protein DinB
MHTFSSSVSPRKNNKTNKSSVNDIWTRIFCMNHLIHHRSQLGVYLRMLKIPILAVYGPSADDENVILIKGFREIKLN